ncbi:MAG: hypothetical protein JRJ59_13690, partial [Deltaproteobacteria bacterium]|nr:hypothetical protein [Deltaproteobacteria bacterium]
RGDYDTLKPGYCLNLPIINSFYVYDRSVQRLDMPDPEAQDAEQEQAKGADRKKDQLVLKPRTLDGNEFDVYVTVLYRVDPDRVRNIKTLYADLQGIREQGVKAEFRGRLVAALSGFEDAHAFYSGADVLRKKIKAITEDMNKDYRSMEKGIIIDEVLIWDYKFKPDIEAKIMSKVLEEASVALARAEQLKTIEEAKVEKLAGKVEAAYEEEIGRGIAEVKRLDAEGEAEMVKAIARGRREALSAKSEGMGAINRALAGRGGAAYIGLEYAKALEGIELIILPASGEDGINPLELDRTIKQLKPTSAGGGGQP